MKGLSEMWKIKKWIACDNYRNYYGKLSELLALEDGAEEQLIITSPSEKTILNNKRNEQHYLRSFFFRKVN